MTSEKENVSLAEKEVTDRETALKTEEDQEEDQTPETEIREEEEDPLQETTEDPEEDLILETDTEEEEDLHQETTEEEDLTLETSEEEDQTLAPTQETMLRDQHPLRNLLRDLILIIPTKATLQQEAKTAHPRDRLQTAQEEPLHQKEKKHLLQDKKNPLLPPHQTQNQFKHQ